MSPSYTTRFKRWLPSFIVGRGDQWARVVMNRETLALIEARGPGHMNVLEISGDAWKHRCKFKTYKNVQYPYFDICSEFTNDKFNLIIAEQVFEHLQWPYRAGRHVYEMLNPGGLFLVTTPFLIKIHEHPLDCSRWTKSGITYFLAECGFPIDKILASSWGNRSCVVANFRGWQGYQPWRHSLANEPEFPVVVWALAQKD